MSFSSNSPSPMKTSSPMAGEPNSERHKYVRGRWKPRNREGGMEHTMQSLCVEVPLANGEEARRELQEAGLLRKELRIERTANVLYIPVNAPPGPHYRTLEREYRQGFLSARSYRDLVEIPPRFRSLLPKAFDAIGDIIILRMPDELREFEREIGGAILRWNPKVRTVAVDEGVKGELRVRRVRIVAGGPKNRTGPVGVGPPDLADGGHADFSPPPRARRARGVKQGGPGGGGAGM